MDGKTWAAVIAMVFLAGLTVYGFIAGRRRRNCAGSRESGYCSGCPYHCARDQGQENQ